MRYLNTHTEFDLLKESMFYVSKDFKDKIQNIDSPITDALLSVIGTDVKPNMTFIKNSDKEGFVEFTQIDNAIRNLEKSGKNLTEFVDEDTGEIGKFDLKTKKWLNEDGEEVKPKANFDQLIQLISKEVKTKNQLKIGKLINKIFPGKFKDKEVEDFVNKFKSESESSDKFDIVKGEDIAYWYDCRNYIYSIKGVLNSSCMKNMNEEVFDIYTSNPDVCRMVILKNEDDELIGRALVWKVNLSEDDIDFNPQLVDVKYFMDRIYHTEDSDVERFKKLAQSKGWAYKAQQSFLNLTEIIYNGKPYEVTMEVNVKPVRYDRYPYMDTFASYDPYDGILVNLEQSCFLIEGEFEISTRGEEGYAEGEGGVWSEWHGDTIPGEDAIYSEQLNDWIYEMESIYIEHSTSGKSGYYPNTYDDIIYDDISKIHIHMDDAVYSEYIGEYYYIENTILVIMYVDKYGKVVEESYVHNEEEDVIHTYTLEKYNWFEKVNEVKKWDDYNGIIDNLMVEDYENDDIPQFLEVESYDISDGDDEEWLTLTDSFLLGKVEKEYDFTSMPKIFPKRTESTFEYFERVWLKGDIDPFKMIDREYVSNLDYIKKLDSDLVIKSIDVLGGMVSLYKEFYELENPNDKNKEISIKENIITSFNSFKTN
jgi:hypothetical protein